MDNNATATEATERVHRRKHKKKAIPLHSAPTATVPLLPENAEGLTTSVLTATEQTLPNAPILLQASLSSSSESGEDSSASINSKVPMSPLPSPPSPLRSSPSAVFLSASAPSPAGSVPPSPAKTTAKLTPYSELPIPGFSSYPEVQSSDLPLPSQTPDAEPVQSVALPTNVIPENQLEQTPQSVASTEENPLESQLSELSDIVPELPEPVDLSDRPVFERMQSQIAQKPEDPESSNSPQIRPSFTFTRKRSEFKDVPGEERHNPRLSRKSVSHVIANLPEDLVFESDTPDSPSSQVSPKRRDSDADLDKSVPSDTSLTDTLKDADADPIYQRIPESTKPRELKQNIFMSACYGVLGSPLRSGALFIVGIASMHLLNLLQKSASNFWNHFQANCFNQTRDDPKVIAGAGAAIALSGVALAAIAQYCCGSRTQVREFNAVNR